MRINRIYTLLLSLFLFCGCADFLDETPDDRMEIETLEQVSELLVNAYPGTSYLFTDWFTDDCAFISTNTQMNYMTEAFEWGEMSSYEGINCVPVDYWMSCYEAIAHANTALEKVEEIKGDADYKNAIRGEALLCRAYGHFMVASLFSDNYDKETAATKMGIPYITSLETVLIKDYNRGTLEDTYNAIEKDLEAGLSLVSDDYYSGSKKYHFTRQAAKAFATRFYLFKKEYDKVIEYADNLLGVGMVDQSYCKDLEEWDNLGAIERQYDFIDTSDPSNLLLIEKKVGIGLRFYYGYRTSADIWQKIVWAGIPWGGVPYFYTALYGDGARNTRKAIKFYEEFYKESLTATIGEPYYMHTVLRGEEVIYNRAEANLMKGNYQAVLDDLNALCTSRFWSHSYYGIVNPNITLEDVKTYYDEDDLDNVLLRLLLANKRREFAHEGMRWFDIKRLGLTIKHQRFDGEIITLEKDDPRKVLQIPYAAQLRGVTKNPRGGK